MNCFRHREIAAVIFCRHCNKPLCGPCCRVELLGQTRVCSEECAQYAAQMPEPAEEEDTPFQKFYACAYLIVLLAVLGGGLCVWIAQSELSRADHIAAREARGETVYEPRNESTVKIFYWLGIRDWKLQFGIGASLGVTAAVLWILKSNRAAQRERETNTF